MSEIIETASTKNNTYMKDYIPWFHIEDNSVVVNIKWILSDFSFVFSGDGLHYKNRIRYRDVCKWVNIALKQFTRRIYCLL